MIARVRRAFAHFFCEQRKPFVLGLLRLAISALLLVNCSRLGLQFIRNGYFGNYFHLPMMAEAWLPSATGYAIVLGVEALAAVLALIGCWPREALLVASSLGLYVLACDRLQYHNNRYVLLLLGFLLAFTPCDRSLLLARRNPQAMLAGSDERLAPTFARRLFQIQVSLVYLGSALGKALDPDWRGGQVLLVRFSTTADYFGARGVTLPGLLDRTLSSLLFANVAAKGAIATELFIALGLWLPRTRRLALWVGVLFHIGIELSARVELFSWIMGAAYLAFVTPELRERRFEYNSETARGRALARLVSVLDWCARFERRALPVGADNPNFYVTPRAGGRAGGVKGAALLAEALPLLFPLWLPLALLARVAGERNPVPSVSSV